MATDRSTVAAPSPASQSRLTNGRELFLGAMDGRSREARRYRDVYVALIQHLGGEDYVTETRRHLAKRAAALIVWAEVEEARLALGEKISIADYVPAINALRRLLGDIGLDRVARDVTPTLGQYLSTKGNAA